MIELPFDCINVHTLSCHRHPRGSKDSEQDNFPFKSRPALPPGCWGQGGASWERWVQLLQPRRSSSPCVRPLNWRYTEPHYPGGQPGRAGKWGDLGAGGGDPAWPALGPEDKMLCLILPVAPKDGVIFLSWQAREGEFRKVKWAGQGHAVSVCQKWGSCSGVFNRLLLRHLRGSGPQASSVWDQVYFKLHRGLTPFLVESGHQKAQIRDVACLLPEPQPEAIEWDEEAGGSDSVS